MNNLERYYLIIIINKCSFTKLIVLTEIYLNRNNFETEQVQLDYLQTVCSFYNRKLSKNTINKLQISVFIRSDILKIQKRHHLVELLGYQCMKIFTEWRQFNSFKIDVERLCMKEYSNHLWTRDEITQHTYRNKLKQIFFINFDMNSKIKQLSTYLWTHISELIDPIFDKVFNDEYNKNMFNESNKLIVNNKSCDKGLQSVGFEKVLQNTTPPSISNNNRLTKSNDVSDIQSLPPLPLKIAHSSNHHSKNDSWNLNDSERNDDHNEIDNQKDATYPLVYYSGEDYSFFCRECRIRSKRLKTNTYRIDNLDIFNKRVQSANTRFPVPASRKRNYNRSNSTGLIKTNSKSTGSRYIGNQKESNKFGDCDNPQIGNKSNKSISPLIENQSKLSSFPKTDISSKIEGSKKSVILDQENTYFDLNVNHEQMRKIPENENRNDYQSCTKQSPQERKHIDDDILEQIFCKIINSVSSTEDDEALAKSVGTQTALTGEKALVIRKKSSTTRRSIAMTKNDSCTEEVQNTSINIIN
ncbi:hypothetical protein GJ496_002835 [Pomphorhynchus laevis]|nr:hypothetical protein GJ496_002835 [Pomphorhynchus laevis]